MENSIKDLSTVTSLPYSIVVKVVEKLNDIISYDVYQSLKSFENICEIDIGIGILSIYVDEDIISYKFKPSYNLENKLIKAVTEDNVSLVSNLESSITEKIVSCYKDLF